MPEVYNLFLHPDLSKGTFKGTVDITVKIIAPCNYIKLHHKSLIIENSRLTLPNDSTNFVKDSFDYPKNEFWVVRLNESLRPGLYSLKLDFGGSLTDDIVGFYRSSYRDDSGENRFVFDVQLKDIHSNLECSFMSEVFTLIMLQL